MKIKENENFPDSTFYVINDSGPKGLKSEELFNDKKVLLIGVPGAFTPTCSEEHLPGYIELADEFLKKGVDKIFCVSTNDPFVVKSWSISINSSKIDFISDGNGDFRNKSGLETDLSIAGLGKRLSRFAMLLENGIIKKIFNEEGPGLDISKASNVLNSI